MSSLILHEFLEVYETEDVLDWWTACKLPHPGCPVGFKIVQQLVLAIHRLPFSQNEKRFKAFKATVGIVSFEATIDNNAIFNWNGMNRKLMVPLSLDYDEISDWQLIRFLYP